MEISASQIQQKPPAPLPVPPQEQQQQEEEQSQPEQKEIRLVDIPIKDENVALNVMVGFLNVAHKRGVFTIDESAKIWECISKFQTTK
jgi:glutathione synthase/RimK-type ligase-like ATP-grasp enzyme